MSTNFSPRRPMLILLGGRLVGWFPYLNMFSCCLGFGHLVLISISRLFINVWHSLRIPEISWTWLWAVSCYSALIDPRRYKTLTLSLNRDLKIISSVYRYETISRFTWLFWVLSMSRNTQVLPKAIGPSYWWISYFVKSNSSIGIVTKYFEKFYCTSLTASWSDFGCFIF